MSIFFSQLVLGRFETSHMGPPGLPIKHAALGFTLHTKDKLLLQALCRMSEIFVMTRAFHSLGWFLFKGYYRNPVEFYISKILWWMWAEPNQLPSCSLGFNLNITVTLDEGPRSRIQWNRIILLAESHKLDPLSLASVQDQKVANRG